jgi:hypothetical protein
MTMPWREIPADEHYCQELYLILGLLGLSFGNRILHCSADIYRENLVVFGSEVSLNEGIGFLMSRHLPLHFEVQDFCYLNKKQFEQCFLKLNYYAYKLYFFFLRNPF